MPILFDYDEETGLKTYFDYDPIKDAVSLTYAQDVSGFLDRMKKFRDDPEYSKKGMKEEWWHYCSIPQIVEIEMRKKGIKLEDKNATKKILREINENYPYLKSTEKRHA